MYFLIKQIEKAVCVWFLKSIYYVLSNNFIPFFNFIPTLHFFLSSYTQVRSLTCLPLPIEWNVKKHLNLRNQTRQIRLEPWLPTQTSLSAYSQTTTGVPTKNESRFPNLFSIPSRTPSLVISRVSSAAKLETREAIEKVGSLHDKIYPTSRLPSSCSIMALSAFYASFRWIVFFTRKSLGFDGLARHTRRKNWI